jgi:hypothetical protein
MEEIGFEFNVPLYAGHYFYSDKFAAEVFYHYGICLPSGLHYRPWTMCFYLLCYHTYRECSV